MFEGVNVESNKCSIAYTNEIKELLQEVIKTIEYVWGIDKCYRKDNLLEMGDKGFDMESEQESNLN